MKYKILIIIFFIITVLILTNILMPSSTPVIKNEDGEVVNNSITEIEKVKIGGVEQYILFRGMNKDNPVILFIHGGPGYSQISFARKYQSELEKNFVVINWDQRGAGKSYNNNIDERSMTLEQFLADTNEVVDYLRKKFNKEKIYLVGHSWGSVLGLLTAKNYPDKIRAYISIGQVVDSIKGEEISYNYTIKKAKADGNTEAMEELNRIGAPPYKNIHDLMLQRKWLSYYDGVEIKINSLRDIIFSILFKPEYSWLDGIKFYKGNNFSMKTIASNSNSIRSGKRKNNMFKQVPKLEIPVYFCIGRNDYNTPYELVDEYYQQLNAPKKELIWFNNSAHFPHFEEPNKFAEVFLEISAKNKP